MIKTEFNTINSTHLFSGKKKCKITNQAEVVMILDSSTSVGPANRNLQLTFMKDVLRPLNIGPQNSRIGLVSYNTEARVVFGLTKYKNYAELAAAVENVEFSEGITATGDALQLAQDKVLSAARPGVPKIIFLVTDGHTNFGADPIAVAAELKKQGVTIITVGITDQIDA